MPTNIPDYASYYRQRRLYAPQEVQPMEDNITLPPRRDVRFPALEEYATQVSQTPQRAQYRPGVLDRIAASMAGFSEGGLRGGGAGVSSALNILNTPYQRALEDYNTRLGGYKGAADVEGEIFNRGQSIENQRLREILGMINARARNRQASASELTAQTGAKRADLYGQDVATRQKRGEAYTKFTTDIYPQIQRERLGQQETEAERRARLYGERTNMMERNAALRANKAATPPKEKFVTPKDQATVDGLALREIRVQAPQLYAEFVSEEGEGSKRTVRIKGATGTKPGMLWGENPLSPEEKLGQQQRFEQFQSLLDTKRNEILQRSGLSTAGYPAIEGDGFSSDEDQTEDEQGELIPDDEDQER